jgi:two-component system, NarL family, nitrate/nitrite response regulator NarL
VHIDVCLASKSDISREGLSYILKHEGFNVLVSGESIDDLVDAAPASDYLTILDSVSLANQASTVARARDELPGSRIVMVSDQFDLKTTIDCLNAGVSGYIIKSTRSTRMIAALRLVALGEKVVPSDFVDTIGGCGIEQAMHSDVDHEIDVLCCLMAGYPNKVIARKLDVCEATVKVHVKAILRKLNVRNRTQAALWANSHGINEAVLVA